MTKPLTISLKNIKYLEIDLSKYVQDLCSEKTKC